MVIRLYTTVCNSALSSDNDTKGKKKTCGGVCIRTEHTIVSGGKWMNDNIYNMITCWGINYDFHIRRQLAVSGISPKVVVETKFSYPLPPLSTRVSPSLCMEERKWTGSTWPRDKGAGWGGYNRGYGSGLAGTWGRARTAPALVPISREVGVERRAVIFKLELLCCRMIGSYPEGESTEIMLNSCTFGCGEIKDSYASVVWMELETRWKSLFNYLRLRFE